MKFINPQNYYIEERLYTSLWTFLFGVLYFIYIGVWRHVFVLLSIDSVSLFLIKSHGFFSLLLFVAGHAFYIFNAEKVVRQKYLSDGWKEIDEKTIPPENKLKCPVCDAPLHKEEMQCGFCNSNLTSYKNATNTIPPDLKLKENAFFIICAVGFALFLLSNI